MGTQDVNYFFVFLGGGKRDRTADLLHAMQALSQLSYTPLDVAFNCCINEEMKLCTTFRFGASLLGKRVKTPIKKSLCSFLTRFLELRHEF